MSTNSPPEPGRATELHCQLNLGSGLESAQAVVLDEGIKVSLVGASGKDMTQALLGREESKPSCLSAITCGVCGSRTINESPEKDALLSFKDLLGAFLDRGRKVVRLVHCPRPGGENRVRKDVMLQVESGADALDHAEAWAAKVSQRCVVRQSGRTRFLVLINPASGSGLGKKIWGEVKELWGLLPWIECEEVVTTRAGEGGDRVKEMSLDEYTGIVIVSGDGLVYEVYNGLAARPDKNKALQMPVGHIPGGSGNGLATSILKSCGENYGVLDAAFLIGKGGQQAIDLQEVRQADRPPDISFLSLSSGVIADIDLESECLRCLGGARFDVYGVYAGMCPRALKAELVYWPADSPIALPEAPSIEEPLSGGAWVKIDDDFTFFWSMNTAWAASNSQPAPGQTLGDGSMSLVIMRRPRGCDLLRCLLGLETGDHVNVPGVEVLRARAYRLTPRSTKGHFAVDGEEVPLSPIQFWPTAVKGNVLGAPFIEVGV